MKLLFSYLIVSSLLFIFGCDDELHTPASIKSEQNAIETCTRDCKAVGREMKDHRANWVGCICKDETK